MPKGGPFARSRERAWIADDPGAGNFCRLQTTVAEDFALKVPRPRLRVIEGGTDRPAQN